MTVEELEFLLHHPRFPQRLLPVLLAELKRQRAIEEGAKDATEWDGLAQAVPLPHRIT